MAHVFIWLSALDSVVTRFFYLSRKKNCQCCIFQHHTLLLPAKYRLCVLLFSKCSTFGRDHKERKRTKSLSGFSGCWRTRKWRPCPDDNSQFVEASVSAFIFTKKTTDFSHSRRIWQTDCLSSCSHKDTRPVLRFPTQIRNACGL